MNVALSQFPYLKHLKATDPLFLAITKPLRNKRGETFREELKRMCKLFEIDGQKDFKKPINFSKSSKYFII